MELLGAAEAESETASRTKKLNELLRDFFFLLIEGKWVSLGESQLTYLEEPAYLSGGFLTRI